MGAIIRCAASVSTGRPSAFLGSLNVGREYRWRPSYPPEVLGNSQDHDRDPHSDQKRSIPLLARHLFPFRLHFRLDTFSVLLSSASRGICGTHDASTTFASVSVV
jgi:hypothetical protein